MFGNNVSDAIMKDLLLPQYGFSIPLNQVATWMIVSWSLYPRQRRAGRAHPVAHTIGHQPHSQVRLVLPTRKFLPKTPDGQHSNLHPTRTTSST